MLFKALETPNEWTWIRNRARPLACEDSQGLVALDDKYRIQAAAVFDSFTPDSCNVHIAIGNPAVIRRGFLHEIARHLFVSCGRKYIFGLVPANNARALKLNQHIGMREVARIPDGYRAGEDYIVMRMDRAGCRWLPDEEGMQEWQ